MPEQVGTPQAPEANDTAKREKLYGSIVHFVKNKDDRSILTSVQGLFELGLKDTDKQLVTKAVSLQPKVRDILADDLLNNAEVGDHEKVRRALEIGKVIGIYDKEAFKDRKLRKRIDEITKRYDHVDEEGKPIESKKESTKRSFKSLPTPFKRVMAAAAIASVLSGPIGVSSVGETPQIPVVMGEAKPTPSLTSFDENNARIEKIQNQRPLAHASFVVENPDIYHKGLYTPAKIDTMHKPTRLEIIGITDNYRYKVIDPQTGVEYEVPMLQLQPDTSPFNESTRLNPHFGIRISTPELVPNAKELGASEIRIAGEASIVGKDGNLADAKTKALLQAAKENNLNVLYLFNPQQLLPESEMEKRLEAILKHNVTLELGNEPDDINIKFWKDRDPKTFAQFIKSASTIARRIKPDVKIVIGAVSASENTERFVQALKEQNVDTTSLIFGVHAYHTPEEVVKRINLLKESYKAYFGKDLSKDNIMLTEFGVNNEHDYKNYEKLLKMFDVINQNSNNPAIMHQLEAYHNRESNEEMGILDDDNKVGPLSPYYFLQKGLNERNVADQVETFQPQLGTEIINQENLSQCLDVVTLSPEGPVAVYNTNGRKHLKEICQNLLPGLNIEFSGKIKDTAKLFSVPIPSQLKNNPRVLLTEGIKDGFNAFYEVDPNCYLTTFATIYNKLASEHGFIGLQPIALGDIVSTSDAIREGKFRQDKGMKTTLVSPSKVDLEDFNISPTHVQNNRELFRALGISDQAELIDRRVMYDDKGKILNNDNYATTDHDISLWQKRGYIFAEQYEKSISRGENPILLSHVLSDASHALAVIGVEVNADKESVLYVYDPRRGERLGLWPLVKDSWKHLGNGIVAVPLNEKNLRNINQVEGNFIESLTWNGNPSIGFRK